MRTYIYQDTSGGWSDFKFQLFINGASKEEIEQRNPGYVFYEVQL